jgi:hypothetical protein
MIGINVPNTRLKRFEQAIEKGELLLMVDVAKRSRRDKAASRRGRHSGNGPDDPGVPVTPRHAIWHCRNHAVRHDVQTNMNDRKLVVVRGNRPELLGSLDAAATPCNAHSRIRIEYGLEHIQVMPVVAAPATISVSGIPRRSTAI